MQTSERAIMPAPEVMDVWAQVRFAEPKMPVAHVHTS